jgi:dipeptidase E
MRLLLLSNSATFGGGYLDHAAAAIAEHFRGAGRIGFVPFALLDQAGYIQRARDRFRAFGIEVEGIPPDAAGRKVIDSVEGVFVGGGNTWRLLDRLQRSGLLDPLRDRVRGGMPYMGSSAGTGIASPTIMTTNDMPIVRPESFTALGLVPFQMNCHYLDPDPASRHMGETRETRLREFLEENDTPVVGLREGTWLEIDGRRAMLRGAFPARLFRRGAEPVELAPQSELPGWINEEGSIHAGSPSGSP